MNRAYVLHHLAEAAYDLGTAADNESPDGIMNEYANLVGVMTVVLGEMHLPIPPDFHARTQLKVQQMAKDA